MSMPEQSQMRDIGERALKTAAVANELTNVMKRIVEEHGFDIAGNGLIAFIAHYVSHFENPCEVVEALMNASHEAMHTLGLVPAEDDEEAPLESIPEEEFFHA